MAMFLINSHGSGFQIMLKVLKKGKSGEPLSKKKTKKDVFPFLHKKNFLNAFSKKHVEPSG